MGHLEQHSTHPGDEYLPEVPSAVSVNPQAHQAHRDLTEVLVSSRAIRGAMHGFLEAEDRLPARRAVFGGRYDMGNIWRYRLGDDALRIRKAQKTAVNTAVWLLLDASGSMDGRALDLAKESLLAAALAMEAIPGTKVGVAIFPYRQGNATVGVVLNPGETVRQHADRFGFEARGGTPLTEALTWVGAQALAMPEERRLVFVHTDGCPDDLAGVVNVVDGLEQAGVECFGIGIGGDAPVQAMFKVHATIEQLPDLRSAVFRMLKEQLRQRR